MDNLLLIDGNSLINRAVYALPPLNNAKGQPTQAVYGFTTMLLKAIAEYSPKYIAVAFDLPAPTYRHKMYDGYKATRKKMPDELAVQLPILKEQLRLMNVSIVEKEGYEADDIIGTLAKDDSVMTYIITGDRDSFQLISETTRVVFTKRGITDTIVLDEQKLMENFSLTPSGVIEYKALAGDGSDNIPGIPGVGEKTALSLLEKYKTVGNVYAHLDDFTGKTREKIENGKESAMLSRELATINCNVPLDVKTSDFTFDYPFSMAVKAFFAENAFRSLVKRDDIFVEGGEESLPTAREDIVEVKLTTPEEVKKALDGAKTLCYVEGEDIRFAIDGKTEYIVPLAQTLLDDGMNYTTALRCFVPVFEDENVRKIVYDGKKVKRELDKKGISFVCYDDVRLMQHLADMRITSVNAKELVESTGGDVRFVCACIFDLYQKLIDDLKQKGVYSLYVDVELPLENVLYEMEKRGVKVDVKLLDELGEEFTQSGRRIEEQIHALAGKKFNVNSPKQLAEVLFEDLAIPYPKKSSKHSTNAEILDMIADKHEIVPLVSQYRFITKLNSTYIEGLKKLLEGDVIHTEYNQMLTSTGRLSSSEPNLQNIPVREEEGKRLRGLFVAREGHTLVSADYSQIELRLLAHLSGDEKMVEQYKSGADIHTRTASEVFGVPASEVTEKMRREAKTVNFGIIYGMSDYGLSQSLKCSVATAKKYMQVYFERFSAIKPYFEGVIESAKECGYTKTILGRMRYIPELASSNFMTRQFGERAAMNMPLQGSAADIIKLAMVSVFDKLKDMKSKLILQIHDELIIEASDDEVEEVKKLLKECMESAIELKIPLTVDVASGKSWLDC